MSESDYVPAAEGDSPPPSDMFPRVEALMTPTIAWAEPAPMPPADSFDVIYAREFDYVWRTLGRLGVPTSDIADAAHDVFVVVYRKLGDLDRGRPLRAWLFGIARRVAASTRRKQRPVSNDEVKTSIAAPAHAERDLLWHALAALDADRREVLVLHDLEGYTGAEIAELLDLSVNTVHSKLRLARADLLVSLRRLRGEP